MEAKKELDKFMKEAVPPLARVPIASVPSYMGEVDPADLERLKRGKALDKSKKIKK